MPYIKDRMLHDITLGDYKAAREPGVLNYQITSLCKDYWDDVGHRYQTINDIIGALECAKQEFYRRVVIPYEDKKIQENGDVY